MDRRSFLHGMAAGAAVARLPLRAAQAAEGLLATRMRGVERDLPALGLGTARRWSDPTSEADWAALRETLARFVALGGQVVDTAPSYGKAEEAIGRLAQELGLRDKLFLATKVGVDSRVEGERQIEESFGKLRTERIDLIAVHNLRDVDAELGLLRELKQAGRVGAVGATTAFERQHADFEAMMRREALDAIQIDYALDDRKAAERILPLAQERGVTVMINLPFGRGRLFEITKGKKLPDWAAEIGAATWAQVFLKYILSHPARPLALPGMAQARYVDDNLGAARAPLPDAAMRRRMEQFIDAL